MFNQKWYPMITTNLLRIISCYLNFVVNKIIYSYRTSNNYFSEVVKNIPMIGGLLFSVIEYLLYSRYEKKYLSKNKSDKVA